MGRTDVTVVAQAENGRDAVHQRKCHGPDLALLEATVKANVKSIFAKLDVLSRTTLILNFFSVPNAQFPSAPQKPLPRLFWKIIEG